MPPDIQQPVTPPPSKKRSSFSLDYRIVIFVLLAIIAGMLVVWKPWDKSPANTDQTVKVTGEATLKAEPDEYVFSPTYQFKNTNKDAALAELTKKSDAVVKKLKELGVADSQIKTNASGSGDYNYYIYDPDSKTSTYTLQLTVTAGNRDLAQKVQDYLVTTTPTGSVSPQPNFSEAKRKELESKARDNATKEARAKADQSARNLGFKVGKVKSVEDGAGFGNFYPTFSSGVESLDDTGARPKLTVQPGENELHYAVTVVYFVK